MRPRYSTTAIVLSRAPLAEASASLSLLTSEFGLVRARAQGLRKQGAKLAPALQTLTECDAILVRGKDGWRLSGARLETSWFLALSPSARSRAGRISALLRRLTHGESNDATPFHIFRGFLEALLNLGEEEAETAECLAALRLLRALGLDAGEMPGQEGSYDAETLAETKAKQSAYVARVNRGISASGL